jgi:hypothetical protein
MFGEVIYIGFFWGQRREGLDACTEKIMRFVEALGKLSPQLREWYRLLEPDGTEKVSMTGPSIRRLLLAGISCGDVGHTPLPGSGYGITIYNNHKLESVVKLSIVCDETSSVPNHCIFESRAGTAAQLKLTKTRLLVDLCRLIVNCWQPDRGAVSCQALHDAIDTEAEWSDVGWIMYRNSEALAPIALNSGGRLERIGNQGALIVVTEDITIPPSPQQIDEVRALYDVLGPSGNLR